MMKVLGTIDSKDDTMVSYKYDAWGNKVTKSIVNALVQPVNSSVYKNYYLDSITFNGLNLFAYCNNNPLDEFVTIGPKVGLIEKYTQSIAQTGNYGQIFVTRLANGMFQIANGHHRVAALTALGYEFIKVFTIR